MTFALTRIAIPHPTRIHRVFVRIPNERGRWLLVAGCVMVACSQCGSAAGVPCRSVQGYTIGHHTARGAAYRAELRRTQRGKT